MSRTFVVKTKAVVIYENWVEVDEEEIDEYRTLEPEYEDMTDESIVELMFGTGDIIADDTQPIDWLDEQVISAREENY